MSDLKRAFEAAGLPYRPPLAGEHWLGCAVPVGEGGPVSISALLARGVLRVTAHQLGRKPLDEALAIANAASLDWMIGGVWVADDDGELEASASVPVPGALDPEILRAVVLHVADAGDQVRTAGGIGVGWPGEVHLDAIAGDLRRAGHRVVDLPGPGIGVPLTVAGAPAYAELFRPSPGLLMVRTRRPVEAAWAADFSRAAYRCGRATRAHGWGAFVRDERAASVYHLAAIAAGWTTIDPELLAWVLERSSEAAEALDGLARG